MVFINDEQKKVLLKVSDLINKQTTFNDITNVLYAEGYHFRVYAHNGYTPKTTFEIVTSDNMPTFVWLKKRRNGLAFWETIKLS